MKNNFIKISLLALATIFTTSCSDDDLTGHSTKEPSSPTLSVALDFANSQTLVEEETTYGFTVSISEPQIVAVRVYLEQTGGDATDGEDFSFPHSVTIPAGSTSVSDVIAIHADDLIEETETATIKIGTGFESNVSAVNEQIVTFSIENLVEGDLMIGLSWEASEMTTDNSGVEIDATDLADLRLLVTDVPYTQILGGADGGSFESFTISSDSDDGEYYIVSDFYDAVDISRELNLTLTLDQVGVINGDTYTFSNALSTDFLCVDNYFILGKVTKTGGSYTFEEVGTNNFASQLKSWGGIDSVDALGPEGGYPSHVTTQVDCEGKLIYGLNREWMQTTWGESIQTEGTVYYTVDESGNVTIPSQYIFTTLYSGALYDYTVSGTGVLDESVTPATLTINYELDQEGFSPSQWLYTNGYSDTTYFAASLVLEE
ncbi:hypothetical protein [Mangrovimonas sp. DI 80]|uniref:hypothetical protein n=1 Tax=Mangrovimonas sp. DI 80 TaxID=1779330 RepID=UPI000976693E|nr:hypothetical protein [Mangrovimonas sp. DI 80]OMP30256.1 hypothetical protein BKM32_12805 [Mangrovimonas sp. DI 80]